MNSNRKNHHNGLTSQPTKKSQFEKITTSKGLHKNNRHQGRYDFSALTCALPQLKKHVIQTPKGERSINFSDPIAVKLLNRALLAYHYGVKHWDIPQGYLCPPIPGRADYIHRAAELLNRDVQPNKVRALDIGVGANCIYPIIGVTEYDWQCTASDIDPVSVNNANTIAQSNSNLKGKIECHLQTSQQHFFKGIIKPGEFYHITTCNPPFHKSLQEAIKGNERKRTNLNHNRSKRQNKTDATKSTPSATLNFGGQNAELWCQGGEANFIRNMALESQHFSSQVLWFSTLISKKENVRWMRKNLEKAAAAEIKLVEMSQGQKISRFIAWTFMDKEQRVQWVKSRH